MIVKDPKRFEAFIWYHLLEHLIYPIKDFHRELISLTRHDRVAIAAPRGHAKAQSLDSKVLTPNGWKTIGSLKEGDLVIGSNGKPTKVVKLHPIQEMELYRVETRDGRSTLCNEAHLWTVQTPSNTKDRLVTKTVKELSKNFMSRRYDKRNSTFYTEYRHFLPTVKPIQFEEKDFIVDPYTLGAWLGDGTSSCSGITTADPEILEFFPYKILNPKQKYVYSLKGLRPKLREINVLNNKHIPEEYLRGSVKQRELLLQGLIDTDGYIHKDGLRFGFCNKSKKLIEGVTALIRSLGGTATVGENWTRFDKNSELNHSYIITGRVPKGITPARLKRKALRWKGSLKTRSAIVSIEKESVGLGRCITVASKDGLYVTDDYMLTHNSSIFSFFYPLYVALENPRTNILLVSATGALAEAMLARSKSELEVSSSLREFYGEQTSNGKKWTNEEIHLQNGSIIMAKGAGKQIRGFRPDLIIADDLETDDIVISSDRRNKFDHWFWTDLLGTTLKHSQIIVVGTILHPESFLAEIINKPPNPWYTRLYKALKEDGTSLWPDQWPVDVLHARREEMGSYAFDQEYMNTPIPDDQRTFQPEWIKEFEQEPENCTYFTTIDPAIKTGDKHDYTAIVTCAVDMKQNIYVVDYINRKMLPSETIDKIFEVYEKWDPATIAIESIGYSELLQLNINKRKKETGLYPVIKDLKSGGVKKNLRIERLQPFAEQGKIHIKKHHHELRTQLLRFPSPRGHDDLIDALSYQLDIIKAPSKVAERINPECFIAGIERKRRNKVKKPIWGNQHLRGYL